MIKEVTSKEAEEYGFSISGETAIIAHVEGLGQPCGGPILFCLGEQDSLQEGGYRIDSGLDADAGCYSRESLSKETLEAHLNATMEAFEAIKKMGLAHIELSVLEHFGFRKN